MKYTLTGLALAALLASSHAVAGEFFIGVNTGTSDFKQLQDECDDLFSSNGSLDCVSVDDSDSTLSFNAGYNFNSFLGIEVGYVDLGEYTADIRFGDLVVTPAAEVDFVYGAAVLTLPLSEQLSISGRVGGVSADFEVTLPLGITTELDNETAAFAGASVDLRIFDQLSLQLRRDTLSEVDITSVGVKYYF